jgi:UDP-N-acetylglucosamine:LPS N-acetylglucosamine transferase
VEERYVSSELLLKTLLELLQDPAKLAEMSAAARCQAHPDAAAKIADMVERIAR